MIPRSLACRSSELLRRELRPSKSAQQYSLLLAEAEDLKAYVHWLHHATVTTKRHSSAYLHGVSRSTATASYNQEYMQQGRLYGFGKRLEDRSFCNAVVDAFLGALRESAKLPMKYWIGYEGVNIVLPNLQTIKYIWANAVDPWAKAFEHNNSMKQLIVKAYAWYASKYSKLKDGELRKCPADFVDAVFNELVHIRLRQEGIVHVNNCDFHTHFAGETCATGVPSCLVESDGESY